MAGDFTSNCTWLATSLAVSLKLYCLFIFDKDQLFACTQKKKPLPKYPNL